VKHNGAMLQSAIFCWVLGVVRLCRFASRGDSLRGVGGGRLRGLLILLAAGHLTSPASQAQDIFFDFDDTGPTVDDEILDFFILLGHEPVVGSNWSMQQNVGNPDDDSGALHTAEVFLTTFGTFEDGTPPLRFVDIRSKR